MSAEMEESFNLDRDIEQIQRKGTLVGVRANNVSEVFMANIDSIADTVNQFQQQSEESFKNEAALYFQNEKQNYERQIGKLKKRLEK